MFMFLYSQLESLIDDTLIHNSIPTIDHEREFFFLHVKRSIKPCENYTTFFLANNSCTFSDKKITRP